jgi:hypothetical protein
MPRIKALLAGAAALSVLAVTPAANAASGSGSQVVSGTVTSAISVVATAVTLSGFSPGSATPATGTGTATVVSTDPYCLTIADSTGNAGKMKGATTNQLTANQLQWKDTDVAALAAAQAYRALSATATGIAGTGGSGQPNTLGQLWNLSYSLSLAGDNLPTDTYSTTATITGTTC